MPPRGTSDFQLTVVIPVFGHIEQTVRCLDALARAVPDAAVLVVDHGPDEGLGEEIAGLHPKAERIAASSDLWWAGATNVGVEHALQGDATHVMLLNADCVIDAESTRALTEGSRHAEIVYPVQRELISGAVLCTGAVPFVTGGFPTLIERRSLRPSRLPVIACGGRGAVISRTVFETIGLFAADDLPHYWADHDFYLRARRAGFRQNLIAGASVLVDESRTSEAVGTSSLSGPRVAASLSSPRSHRNREYVKAFFRRNYPIRALYHLGSGAYTARYLVSWGIQRAWRLGRIS